MGEGVEFAGANRRYSPPEGVSEDECKTLHIFSNGRCLVSCWQLSDDEIAEVIRSRRVFLSVWSAPTLFPVFVGSESVTRGVVADYGGVWKAERKPITLLGHEPLRPLDQTQLEAISDALDPARPSADITDERLREICSWFALPERAIQVVIAAVRRRP